MKIGKSKKQEKTLSPKEAVEEIATTYQHKQEIGAENPIDDTVEKVMQIIAQNTDQNKVRELLKQLLDSKSIPDRIFERTAAEVSTMEEIPDKIIPEAVEQSKVNVSDNVIDKTIEEGDIEPNARLKLIQSIDSKNIRIKRVKNELKILYRLCKSKTDNEVIDRISNLRDLIKKDGKVQDIKELEEKVVAKKMAEDYYNDKLRSVLVSRFIEIIPIEQMAEIDLPSLVEEEFKKIEMDRGIKKGRYNKEDLQEQIDKRIEDAIKKGKIAPKENKQKLVTDPNTVETIDMLENEGVLELLGSMSEENRQKAIKSIGEVLKQREYLKSKRNAIEPKLQGTKISKNIPKIQSNQNLKIQKREVEGR